MIKGFRLLRNIGNFYSVDAGKDIDLGKLTLCYADNGRGKTTLASVLRSLSEGDPVPIVERKRLHSQDSPHVVIDLDDNSPKLVFKDTAWSSSLGSIVVFDDTFVEQNVYSGLTVSPQQRQRLHDLILGPQAVKLQRRVDEQVEKIENHNRELKAKEGFIPVSTMGGLSIDEFCALPARSDIDEAIQKTELDLAAAQQQDAIQSTANFDSFNLPEFDLTAIDEVLQMDLDSLESVAYERVKEHLIGLGQDGETWISDGMRLIKGTGGGALVSICPFCAQSLEGSSLIQHYQAYFSAAYADMKQTITNLLEDTGTIHSESVQAEFEQKLRIVGERRQFWTRFCEVKEFTIDTSEIFRDYKAARESMLSLITAKQASPLQKLSIPETERAFLEIYRKHIIAIAEINTLLEVANKAIKEVKERVISASVENLSATLNSLKTAKIRHAPDISDAYDAYLKELKAKSETEETRDQTRTELNRHRETVFPKYQTSVNQYLEKFGAGFRLDNVKPANLRTGSTSTYEARVGGASVAVGRSNPAPSDPSFGSVLGGGDRTTLAFAFFLASLEQRDDLGDTVVVIDDPISSMDTDRSLTTVQEIRALALRAAQVIVLSHEKAFLCRIWEHADRTQTVAFEIARSEDGSTLRKWNVSEDSLTQHDRRYKVLRGYLDTGTGEQREVARDIRHHLEGFLRNACPGDFLPGNVLGHQFLAACQKSLNGTDEILPEVKLHQLRDILEYANKFHHESNPAGATEPIHDGELRTFVKRTLDFTKP